jgi:hypothetical protein
MNLIQSTIPDSQKKRHKNEMQVVDIEEDDLEAKKKPKAKPVPE